MYRMTAGEIEMRAKEMFLDWLLSLPLDVDPFKAASEEILRIKSLEAPRLLDYELKQLFCQMLPLPEKRRNRNTRSLH